MKVFIIKLWMVASIAGIHLSGWSQQTSENIVIVTLDGLRWQEIFKGVDTVLVKDKEFTRDDNAIRKAWGDKSEKISRKKLFPFFWDSIASVGALLGNRTLGNKVNLANPYWFSYPGYNELLTGYPDREVNSNDKKYNKNITVLEYLNQLPGFKGKVAAFGTWDVFPYIINDVRSGIYVNAGEAPLPFEGNQFELLNDMQRLSPQPIGVRHDVITYLMAKEYLKAFQPRVLYIAFDETDDFAHAGLYDQYLKSAHAQDGMIADLWQTLQNMPQYKGKTTLLITTDHGRGDAIKAQWKDHGSKVLDCNQTWIAAIGPSIAPQGEATFQKLLQHAQIATTIAAILGEHYQPEHKAAPPIVELIVK